jgi:hypothetical protein
MNQHELALEHITNVNFWLSSAFVSSIVSGSTSGGTQKGHIYTTSTFNQKLTKMGGVILEMFLPNSVLKVHMLTKAAYLVSS